MDVLKCYQNINTSTKAAYKNCSIEHYGLMVKFHLKLILSANVHFNILETINSRSLSTPQIFYKDCKAIN